MKENKQRMRYFSESFRLARVSELDQNLKSIPELIRDYGMSRTALYNWLYKYSKHYKRESKQVIELKSEASKTKKLKDRVAELEQALGRKQMELDYYKKLVEVSDQEMSKKKSGPKSWSGSVHTKKNTGTK